MITIGTTILCCFLTAFVVAAIVVACTEWGNRPPKDRERCSHPKDLLCAKYGCPDDPKEVKS